MNKGYYCISRRSKRSAGLLNNSALVRMCLAVIHLTETRSSHGSRRSQTNFDKLAKYGLSYNMFHTMTLCSPTRAMCQRLMRSGWMRNENCGTFI